MNLKKVKYSQFDLSFVKLENWIGFENNFKQYKFLFYLENLTKFYFGYSILFEFMI